MTSSVSNEEDIIWNDIHNSVSKLRNKLSTFQTDQNVNEVI
jgi:hypothetical protein